MVKKVTCRLRYFSYSIHHGLVANAAAFTDSLDFCGVFVSS
jgi:hypothetical protein